MQNKGAIKVLAILLGIACAYQLSFTFVTRNIENRAARYAAGFPVEMQEAKQHAYLDSIRSQKVWLGFTYKDVKNKELNLGLDLKGGMNVMLEISVEDVVRALSGNSQDPVFTQALDQARLAQKTSSEDFISLFTKGYAELSGNAPLAYIFNTQELKDRITPTSTNEQVVRVLREEAESAISNSYNVLRSRIDRFGVTQPNLQRIGNTGRILVELPGVKEPERVRKLLQGTASLEFWPTYDYTEILPMLEHANDILNNLNNNASAQEPEPVQDVAESGVDEQVTDGEGDLLDQLKDAVAPEIGDQASDRIYVLGNKLFAQFVEGGEQRTIGGPVVGFAMSYDTAAVNSMLNQSQVRMTLPRDLRLMWGVNPIDKAETIYELYAIRANTRDGRAPLDGGAVSDARGQYSDSGGSRAEVSMTMTPAGAKTWQRLTADNIGRSIAIVLDGYVYSAPTVQNEIPSGRSQITGNFTITDATDLANVLKSGKLPAPARITQEAVVGPSLGAESINSSMVSFLLAFAVTLIYMIVFYNRAGWVASVALLCNLFFLFGVLASFGAVLTLPGIAGIVLTMAMAVDANVIIYERVKEELRSGKALSAAVAAGYKHAMATIIDANLTSLITGIVLFMFGTGPVQGFATTFIVGIITSFFTSIFITRLMFSSMLDKGKKIRFSNKFSENFLSNTKFNFIGKRRMTYIISLILICVSVASLLTRGLSYGVDFTGGRTFVVRFDQNVSVEDARRALEDVFMDESVEGTAGEKSIEVKRFGTEAQNQVRIVTQYKHDDMSDDATEIVEELVFRALEPLYADRLTFNDFLSTANNPYGIISADMVGPNVASDITRNSFIAVIFTLFAIGLYILLRFKKWQYGLGSVAALAHDTFLTIGAFSLLWGVLPFNLEVNQSFIAALLTIIGYSINDKVVIFDRIREYTGLYPKRNLKDTMNYALNSTMSRTVNTSGSTVITLLAIFLFGGEVIRGFVFAILIGVIISVYSSIFTATPVAYDFMSRKLKSGKENK